MKLCILIRLKRFALIVMFQHKYFFFIIIKSSLCHILYILYYIASSEMGHTKTAQALRFGSKKNVACNRRVKLE